MMKRINLLPVTLLLILAAMVFSCKPKVHDADAGKQAVKDTIQLLMNEILRSAEQVNLQGTFSNLSDDSGSVFFSQGMHYSKTAVLARYKGIFETLKSQKFDILQQDVVAFSSDAAMWTAVVKGQGILKNDQVVDEFLVETWFWNKENGNWRVVHFHESGLNMPGQAVKAEVERALSALADNLKGKQLTPAEMPAILKDFLKKTPVIYGATLAFAPTQANGERHEDAPYVYRAGEEFIQVEIPASYDYTLSEWYAKPVELKNSCWSLPYFDAGGGNALMITYSIPMYLKDGQLLGVLTSDLEIK